MSGYWIEEYESGWPITPFKDEIINRCKEILKEKKMVRIGYVMLEEMNLELYKASLVEIVAYFEETGKYHARYIRHENGSDDFLVFPNPKKPLTERYWFVVELLKYSAGIFTGYAISKLFHI
jgi:hypothetical protein